MKKLLFFVVPAILFSCDHEVELRRSVFIPDPDAPGLPKYSEWGYNTFGAYYGRDIIVSNDYEIPVQVIQQSNSTIFKFRGQKGYYSNGFEIRLVIPDFAPSTYQDVISLHQQVIDLSDEKYTIAIEEDYSTHTVELLGGTFEFKRAQNLLVDGEDEEVILSGVFEFQMVIDGEPVSITEGRFDVGVGSYNFFVLD